ncbi:hypothetical protein RJ640_027992 [Escallonia rubra]|uniref:Uncharacterized protein n=1 Tax=Escallonia rubra TaxID=112253 RepID=A0AA88UPJ7_9ASTE|nr:hypothetical protein RJ640_027995 [Escallonia rubra]KAK2988753.1 hypothetical protein RJ640_027992 [Escallonia rubra]
MESSGHTSLFKNLKSRELNGFRARKRPCIAMESSEFNQTGAVAVESPPMALSFCKDGNVGLYNTRSNFLPSSSHEHNTEKAKVCHWAAHDNAVFDICWIKVTTLRIVFKNFSVRVYWLAQFDHSFYLSEDCNMLTASGDHTIKIWDIQAKKCIGTMLGHAGSVKSICSHPTNHDLLVSGSRDGSFALWDTRCCIISDNQSWMTSIAAHDRAHVSTNGRQTRRGKAASKSITSVLYLKDEVSIATAGAVDSVVKFWDTRSLKSPVSQACPKLSSQKDNVIDSLAQEKRLHGISSLSQDQNGVFLSASCMDNRIYLYNVLQLEKGPTESFSGCQIESFFVKSAISPDAAHILGGSSDGNAYIWQVNKPRADPIVLESHGGEVTAVAWCSTEIGKIATSSDDFTVRFWNLQRKCYSETRSPSSIRRRIMAPPRMECRNLFIDEQPTDFERGSCPTNEAWHQLNPPSPTAMPEIRTPDAQKRKVSSHLDTKETYEGTPEAALNSPSSVLSPPSSLKRKTIRDYFLAVS